MAFVISPFRLFAFSSFEENPKWSDRFHSIDVFIIYAPYVDCFNGVTYSCDVWCSFWSSKYPSFLPVLFYSMEIPYKHLIACYVFGSSFFCFVFFLLFSCHGKSIQISSVHAKNFHDIVRIMRSSAMSHCSKQHIYIYIYLILWVSTTNHICVVP